jgi:acyl-CoA reductase-like NAD-dependent aldehyde dehydrogenase
VTEYEGTFEVRNPADTAEIVGTYEGRIAADVDAAVEAGAKAQLEWGSLSAAERLDILRTAVPKVEALLEPDALLVREQGKVRWEATFEVGFLEMMINGMAESAELLDAGELVIDDGMGKAWVHYEPIGVVAAITPWNYPVAISADKVVPALLAGNAVILKTAPTTPLTAQLVFDTLADVLPPGLLTTLTGPIPTVGARLLGHPGIGKVSFTGSCASGRTVAAAVSSTLKNLTLELGGNDAALILDDAVVDEKLCGDLVTAAFTTTGQVCLAVKRVYAPRRLLPQLADGIAAVLADYVIGPGLADESTMGPLHTAAQRDKVRELVADARAQGATVRTCGILEGDPERGYFELPTVVTDIAHDARLVREEQFGPSLPLLAYDDLDHAIAMVNDSDYGLASSIWTADEDRAVVLARRIQAGSTYINAHGLFAVDPRAPFGGIKQSGIGRELGREGLLSFTETHTISTRHM